MIIGAQFYTLRDFCQDAEGIIESLKKVKEIGYSAVQLSGIARMDTGILKENLDSLGLDAVVTHIPYDAMKNNVKAVAEAHKMIGCKYVGLGCMPQDTERSEKGFISFAKELDDVAKEYKKEGLKVTYHNHHFEFMTFGGKTGLELMKENSECFEFLLDVHWIQRGGSDVCDIIEKFADRISIIHFKDMSVSDKAEPVIAEVGYGNLNWNKIIPLCEKTGITHAFVEQDDCYGRNPFDSMKMSYDFLKGAGLK